MDNNLLKYLAFVKTVDTGSFSKAAENLNYAQSSISKMIMAGAFIAACFLNVNVIYIILTCIALGVVRTVLRRRKGA